MAIRDSPGQVRYAKDVWGSVAKYNPKILVILFADGFLASAKTGNNLRRPGIRQPTHATLDDFLLATRKEELEWLEEFTYSVVEPGTPIKYLVLAVNKVELWSSRHPDVLGRYVGGDFQEQFRILTKKIAVPGQTAQAVSVSADYNGFKNKLSPESSFDKTASRTSLRLFKAFLAGLMVDGEVEVDKRP